jgi:hypothetical protein
MNSSNVAIYNECERVDFSQDCKLFFTQAKIDFQEGGEGSEIRADDGYGGFFALRQQGSLS